MEIQENLHYSLLFLMNKLEDIQNSPMQDKTFVSALTDVLRYFRDNGELRKAYELHKASFEDLEKSPWCKMIMAMCSTKMNEFGVEIPPIDIKEHINKISSDEYIEGKIKQVLGE